MTALKWLAFIIALPVLFVVGKVLLVSIIAMAMLLAGWL